jgi:ABC-type multidrug transport system ATPase subunit
MDVVDVQALTPYGCCWCAGLLTGLIAPDSGSAMVGGFDVISQREQMRQNLGMCPQHDILYSELTAEEQLVLYGSMQGLSDAAAADAAAHLLRAVGLWQKRGDLTKQMSGGQRRRLSLASALIGSPRVCFLDEPTTGMDPHNRQLCWVLLQQAKAYSTVLLTTHSMEEADLLGDTLGIMATGQLQASGTSIELKQQYGHGYGLHVVKRATVTPTEKAELSTALLACVQEHVPAASVRSDVGAEVTITLPTNGAAAFPQLFRRLEADMDCLNIAAFGLTQSSLEEVFLNLAEESASNCVEGDDETEMPFTPMDEQSDLPSFDCEPTFQSQLLAVMWQVQLQARRNPIGIIHGVVAPVVFTYLATLIVPFMRDDPPQEVPMRLPNGGSCADRPWAGNMSLQALGQLPSLDYVSGPQYVSCDALVADLFAQKDTADADAVLAYCHHTHDDEHFSHSDTDGWHSLPQVGATALLFNSSELYSLRTALACFMDAVSQSALHMPLSVSYKAFPASVSMNQISGGALMGFVSMCDCGLC